MAQSPGSSPPPETQDQVQRLLARTPVIRGPCELDLLVFLHRHPRTLLTNEQLAAFVGYDMKQVAGAIEAFVAAGLLARTQTSNPLHAARMYLLVLESPQGKGVRALLEPASSRQGRRSILHALSGGRPRSGPAGPTLEHPRLHAIA
ncbi:MAG TPA: hypothetical protein VFV65_06685 [Gemmatimonadales bacterium]|nr:hypothetical protein [Gemmatimonadales bacterium]